MKNKFRVCISIGTVGLLVCSLGFVIYLGINQHKTMLKLSNTADRMQENINMLFDAEEMRKAKEAAAIELEEQTAEDMKGLN